LSVPETAQGVRAVMSKSSMFVSFGIVGTTKMRNTQELLVHKGAMVLVP